jgi:eukaryotic-like serine/threonine-protein kinase
VTQWPNVSNTPPRPPGGPGAAARRPRVRRANRSLVGQLIELIAIVAFVFVAYEVGMWAWSRSAPREVAVPKVAGMPMGDATSILRSAGLQSEIAAERPDEKVPEGVVISTDPGVGRQVKAGRLVRLVVSSGSRWAKVPEVTKMSVDRAKAALNSAKLSLGHQTAVYDGKVPAGYIIGQDPKPGTRLVRNSEVTVRVSLGTKPEAVPDTEEPPSPDQSHSTQVEIVVPPGASLQEVRIVVRDGTGVHTVYRGNHQPGETVTRTVRGQGAEAVVEVYLSGVLAETRNF